MTKMKSSGIDWIGEIPEEWQTGKIKFFSKISAGSTPDRTNELFWNGNINWMSSGEVNQGKVTYTTEKITELGLRSSSTKVLPVGTVMLALNGQGKTKGTAAILEIETASNQSLASFVIDRERLNESFVYYYFKANYFNIRGMKGEDRDGLNLQLVSNINVPIPPLSEQTKIADYLDKQVAQLDKVKVLLEEQIATLQEYRQSLIYETVTEGLDKTVPMKDSGVDWIGQIPKGWGLKSIKYLVSTPVTDGPHETPILCDKGIPFLSAEAVKNGILNLDFKRGYISEENHRIFSRKVSPRRNDIFIVKSGATTGNVGIVETDEIFDIWSPLALVRSREDIAVQKFVYYFMLSEAFSRQVQSKWSFGTQQNIGMKVIEGIKVVIPDLDKQYRIVNFLDKKIAQISQMIAIKQDQIDNIIQQRQTLIYDLVTGKRRV
ncbi:restriction endonuclease subunit S [Streptococcus pluranimalium]|uniref:restriction endonuclease subunit S n=1 Tax=Streptococcus pluranimalium TaxID=82348 RepID=UPI00346675D6